MHEDFLQEVKGWSREDSDGPHARTHLIAGQASRMLAHPAVKMSKGNKKDKDEEMPEAP